MRAGDGKQGIKLQWPYWLFGDYIAIIICGIFTLGARRKGSRQGMINNYYRNRMCGKKDFIIIAPFVINYYVNIILLVLEACVLL